MNTQTNSPESQARAFLKFLDPHTDQFCFRVLPDNKGSPVWEKKFNGKFGLILPRLRQANRAGGGTFVVVNVGGQKDSDITRVRAVFADTDGAPVKPIIEALQPHMVIESSPENYHTYWFVADFPLDQFKPVQLAIAHKFGTDKKVCNPSRVMRMPGFFHNKNDPVLSRFVKLNRQLPHYTFDEIVMGLGLQLQKLRLETQSKVSLKTNYADAPPIAEVEGALAYLNPFVDRDLWVRNILALAHDYGEDGRDLAHRWSRGDLWNGDRDGA
jgi:hypothetical protein